MRRRKPILGALLTLFILGTAGYLAAARASGGRHGTWSQEQSPTQNQLNAITCPNSRMCVAVGDTAILTTTNAGKTWRSTNEDAGPLHRVSCPSTAICFTVGWKGAILSTADGGRTWRKESSGTTEELTGIGCPSTTTCHAVGEQGTVLTTRDGGRTWRNRSRSSDTFSTNPSCPRQAGCPATITCPSTERCYVAGLGAGI